MLRLMTMLCHKVLAKGYTHQIRVDYDDTFSTTVRLTTIHMILTIATSLDLELRQLDNKIIFLNGEYEEEIYMKHHEYFVQMRREHLM